MPPPKSLATGRDLRSEPVGLPVTVKSPVIVGIGASAGGLAALEAFFLAMPASTEVGFAFVVIQHLAPDHKSILTELIQRYTTMQVFEVTEGTKVSSQCVYVIPPYYDLIVAGGTLHLVEPTASHGLRLPIDFFFNSLAQEHKDAICVVLSGTGKDGTRGATAVSEKGGLVIAQTPDSAEHDGMPRSLIDSGKAEFVLAPAEMPSELIRWVYRKNNVGRFEDEITADILEVLEKICDVLRAHSGHDFPKYKHSTVMRRIQRRLVVNHIESWGEYLKLVESSYEEADLLLRDLLIGVTSFFRDTKAFDALGKEAIADLVAAKPEGSVFRAWIAGCSTGEEAYSLAILLREAIDASKRRLQIQIFATDIDSRAIEHARNGVYPAAAVSAITPERVSKYFTQASDEVDSYRIQKFIRDTIVFSEQDVIRDPPISKVDLVACRNLLIYLDWEAQKKLIPIFHYALNPGGTLFLGTSETIGESSELFAISDRESKISTRRENSNDRYRPYGKNFAGRFAPEVVRGPSAKVESKPTLQDTAERAILRHLSIAGALVTDQGDILYLHGRTGQYLEPVEGGAEMNILRMAREGLQRELSTAIYHVLAHKKPITIPAVRVKTNGDYSLVDLTVRPVGEEDLPLNAPNLVMVIFEASVETGALFNGSSAKSGSGHERHDDKYTATLRHELRAKEDYLRATNEELRASNEELQSTNEELQSANEELETSKEELQSLNEELATVNSELKEKVSDLSVIYNDMNNLLSGTGIGTVFVDHKLCIQRFTPAVTQVINFIPSDVGRPVGHIVSNLANYDRLVDDVSAVLDSLIPKEIEVRTRKGLWYVLHIRPYRTLENIIEGAVITFVDITTTKKAQHLGLAAEELFRLLCDQLPQIVWTCEKDGAFDYLNARWNKLTGIPATESLGRSWSRQLHPDDRDRLVTKWDLAIAAGNAFEFDFRLRQLDGSYGSMRSFNIPYRNVDGQILKWLGTIGGLEGRESTIGEIGKPADVVRQ